MISSSRVFKIAFLYVGVITFGFIIFLFSVALTIVEPRKLPNFITKKYDNATRGEIISKDGYHLSTSKKIYTASINTNTLNKDKKNLFIKLFSIYSGIDKSIIKKKIDSRKGYILLAKNINAKDAKHLKSLSYKLNSMKVFDSYESKELNKTIFQGLDIIESGEQRVYNFNKILSPYLGYIRNEITKKGRQKVKGIKGIENYYDEYLNYKQDGYIIGKRDRPSNIIINNRTKHVPRIDGVNIILNINLNIQKKFEHILDKYKQNLNAKEIVCAVMDSQSGKLLSIATSNRFNPNKILKVDIKNLNATASEYQFEPGSVMKPIIFSLLLEKNLISPIELVRGYNGRYKLGKRVITDTHKAAWLSAEDIIVHSSNIGMAQIVQRLSSVEIYTGLQKFGFIQSTNIDLPYEQIGNMASLKQLESPIYKASISYGYSIRSTFLQLLQAYSIFNSNGYMSRPKIVDKLEYYNDQSRNITTKTYKIISSTTAVRMHNILKKVVNKGTGIGAHIEGLEIGGKTGTAHIAKNGAYVKEYISSFFGYANDANKKFTIGITVFEPKKNHFAAQSAVPIFKEMIDVMLEQNILKYSDDKLAKE